MTETEHSKDMRGRYDLSYRTQNFRLRPVCPSFHSDPYKYSITDTRTGATYYFDSVSTGFSFGRGDVVNLCDHNGDTVTSLFEGDVDDYMVEILEELEEEGEIPSADTIEEATA